eukprot:Skav215052  [mRNA]  locus=scaffold1021:115470:117107:+ [translate_table: standard]
MSFKNKPFRNIPNSYHTFCENGVTVKLPYIKPTDVFKTLLSKEPWLFLGGLKPGPSATELLDAFWRLYRLEHPSHTVFQLAAANKIELNKTIPVFLHGDAGRTQKKAPLEVMSFRPALGLDTEHGVLGCTCDQKTVYCGQRKSNPLAQRLNNRNHSYLTHFLMCAYPSKRYKSTPGLLASILEAISKDLDIACREGISIGDTVYHVGVLGMAGDMEYHAKTGVLSRCYHNVGHRNFIPCCHECMAGEVNLPFEDVSASPRWVRTLYRDAPWNQLPPFKHIPFDNWHTGQASRFFKKDPFHIFRLGIARNFIGSTIVLFCLEGVFDNQGDSMALDQRLSRAWSLFSLWCNATGASVSGLRSFSKEKLHMPKLGVFPWLGCKGSDSIVILKWLRFLSGLHAPQHPGSRIFPLVIKACDSGLSFQSVHRHGIWLPRTCRDRVMRAAKCFVQSYARLAHIQFSANRQLYAMVPKLHSMDHFAVQLSLLYQDEYSCNPALFDCSMSEDFIGRVSRQSRRVSNKYVVENTLLVYKVKSQFILKRFKKQRLS